MKKKYFDIATLSDCLDCNGNYSTSDFSRYMTPKLGDPVTIITGGVALLSQLFPGLFGVARRRLTDQDWLNLFPGNGEWTTKLRNYLKARIHYDVDLKNIQPFTDIEFITENRNLIPGCGGRADQNCIQSLYSVLQQEKQAQTPGGIYGGGGKTMFAPGSNMPLLFLGAGFIFLIMQANKKRR